MNPIKKMLLGVAIVPLLPVIALAWLAYWATPRDDERGSLCERCPLSHRLGRASNMQVRRTIHAA